MQEINLIFGARNGEFRIIAIMLNDLKDLIAYYKTHPTILRYNENERPGNLSKNWRTFMVGNA